MVLADGAVRATSPVDRSGDWCGPVGGACDEEPAHAEATNTNAKADSDRVIRLGTPDEVRVAGRFMVTVFVRPARPRRSQVDARSVSLRISAGDPPPSAAGDADQAVWTHQACDPLATDAPLEPKFGMDAWRPRQPLDRTVRSESTQQRRADHPGLAGDPVGQI